MARREVVGAEEETQQPTVCPICEKVIVDASETEEGEDAVFCDGDCQCWMHRCCACLPKAVFENLTKQEPFYCPRCSIRAQMKAIGELRDTVAALSAQIQELQNVVTPSGSSTPARSSNRGDSWTTVVKKGRKQQREKAGGNSGGSDRGRGPERTGNVTKEKNAGSGAGSQAQERGEKVLVKGKRRIGGTLKACTSNTAKHTTCQLTGVAKEKLQFRRKYKKLPNNKMRWWHIVSGDESDLEKLESEWEAVKFQTGWKLEKCYTDENFLKNGDDSPPT